MNASSPLLVSGLEALSADYSAVLCDVWGVLHNGVAAFEHAHKALRAFREETGGVVVLITNAPRPAPPVREQLAQLGVPNEAYDDIVTSGDVTRELLAQNAGSKVFHIGPGRDLTVYEGTGVALGTETEAEILCCTGLFDDEQETPDDYRDQLQALAARGLPMICANPDIVVERGEQLTVEGVPQAVRLDPPAGLLAALYIPDKHLSTAAMRAALPASVSFEDAVHNVGAAALAVAALSQGQLDLLRPATVDRLHEPYRASAYPELPELIEAALAAGAQGACLSGAGPTVVAFSDYPAAAATIAAAMERRAQRLGLSGRVAVQAARAEGARVVHGIEVSRDRHPSDLT